MDSLKAKETAEKLLSKERFFHSKAVAQAAKSLAVHYKADIEEALICGYLHDIVKEFKKSDLLQMIEGSDMIEFDEIRDCPSVWHAYAGGVYAHKELGLKESLASAIACHTTGKVSMSMLEMIIFLADYISEDRDIKEIEEIRELAFSEPASTESLQKAVLEVIKRQIIHLMKHGRYIDLNMLRAYNYFVNTLYK